MLVQKMLTFKALSYKNYNYFYADCKKYIYYCEKLSE